MCYESWNCMEEDHNDQQESKHRIIYDGDTHRDSYTMNIDL